MQMRCIFDVTFSLCHILLLNFDFWPRCRFFCDPSAEVLCVGAGREGAEIESPAQGVAGTHLTQGGRGSCFGS